MTQKLSFRDAKVCFATNHQKGTAAREPFLRILNTQVEELQIDSDRLGTFSGEIERPGSMLDALRGKIKLAREVSRERFILVSEGSFSTAGGFGVIAQGIEMLLLDDAITGTQVIEQHISWDTNYLTAEISKLDELDSFLPRISFGSHGLVLYPCGATPSAKLFKGIFDTTLAHEAFQECLAASPVGRVMAMSDMRAHCNPTRMKAISACCELLAKRLATVCSYCGSGGFGITGTVPGLPCESCGFPTARARLEKHTCVVCHATTEQPRSDGKVTADPAECELCNP
jgi:hypothetical protein